MKRSVTRIRVDMSERREKLNALLEHETPTDEQRREIDEHKAALQELEPELREAELAAEQATRDAAPDGEALERERLRGRVELRAYVEAAIEKRAVDGAGAEFNAALGMGAHRFPLELLAPAGPERVAGAEARATTDETIATTPSRWLDRLFAVAAAARLGVTFEGVSPGEASYPITTGGASAAQRARRQAAMDAAWTIGSTKLDPTRNSVRAVFTREDDMRNPGLQEALRRDLAMALADGIDRAIFLGDDSGIGDAADIVGLNAADGVVQVQVTQANKVKGDATVAAFAGMVDGIHAERIEDLRVVASVGSNTLWLSTLTNAAADSMSVAQYMKASGLMWTVRGDIDDATAAGDVGAFVGRSRGLMGAGVAAIWEDAMLIVDPYSAAAKGEIAMTLCSQWNFGLVRPTNFARVVYS